MDKKGEGSCSDMAVTGEHAPSGVRADTKAPRVGSVKPFSARWHFGKRGREEGGWWRQARCSHVHMRRGEHGVMRRSQYVESRAASPAHSKPGPSSCRTFEPSRPTKMHLPPSLHGVRSAHDPPTAYTHPINPGVAVTVSRGFGLPYRKWSTFGVETGK